MEKEEGESNRHKKKKRVKIQVHETLFSFLKRFFNYSFKSENCQQYVEIHKSNARRNNKKKKK